MNATPEKASHIPAVNPETVKEETKYNLDFLKRLWEAIKSVLATLKNLGQEVRDASSGKESVMQSVEDAVEHVKKGAREVQEHLGPEVDKAVTWVKEKAADVQEAVEGKMSAATPEEAEMHGNLIPLNQVEGETARALTAEIKAEMAKGDQSVFMTTPEVDQETGVAFRVEDNGDVNVYSQGKWNHYISPRVLAHFMRERGVDLGPGDIDTLVSVLNETVQKTVEAEAPTEE